MASREIVKWGKHARFVANSVNEGHPVLVLHYEDLKDDLEPQLRRLNSFLCLPTDEERIHCVLDHREGNFRRNK